MKIIQTSQKLVIPPLSFWPRQLYFPNADEITIVNWNRRRVFCWLHHHHFPAVKRINYLCDEDLPYGIYNIFTVDNSDFKFREFSVCFEFTSKLREVPKNYCESLSYIEYSKLIKQGTDKKYIEDWEKFIKDFSEQTKYN